MKILRKICSAIVILAMLVGFLPVGVQSASAATNVQYIDADGREQTQASATDIASNSTTWSTGWYVVNSSVTISSRITVNGDVHLILADGCTLTASAGITVSQGNSLTIYGQAKGTGTLNVTSNDYGAAIGGGNGQNGGNITINGGTVTATSYDYCYGAAIGGGRQGAGGDITINGGTVTATSNDTGAAIGGGYMGAGGKITINGGTVTATSYDYGAAIGGGWQGAGGDVTINGGTVTAKAEYSNVSDIGSGWSGNGGTVTVIGGYINASSINGTTNITGGYFNSKPLNVQDGYTAVNLLPGQGYGDTNYRNDYPYAVYSNGTSLYSVSDVTTIYGTDYTPTVSGNTFNVAVNYSYQSGGETVNGLPSAAGKYTVTAVFAAHIDGANKTYYPAATATFNVTINKQPSAISVSTSSITATYGDIITVKGTIAASATAPGTSTNAITQNQVGLYLADGTELATASVGDDDSFTLSYDTAGKKITPSTSAQTLTVKYGGSSALNSGSTTVQITLNKKSVTAQVQGDITKVYDGNTSAMVSLAVVSSDLVNSNDQITVTGTGTYVSADVADSISVTVSDIQTDGADKDWYSVSAPTGVTGSITAAQSSVTSAPTANTGLTYTGEAQTLVSAGTASGGTMVYALGADADNAPSDNYSETVPTGTNAGTYYVWYKVQGDGNHNDSDLACVEVTIGQVTLTVSAAANDKTYDGTTAATGSITLTGAMNGEQPTAIGTFAFEDANAGENKAVSVTGIALADNWSTNYVLNATSTSTTATITKATPALTLSADRDTLSGGGRVTLTLSGVPEDASATVTGDHGITVTDNGDGTWTASLPNRTATYTFTATTSGSGNYNAATATTTVRVQSYIPPTTPSEPEKPSGPSTGDSDGWTSILDEILDAEDGDTITIDMNGETEVPGEIFEAVADRNVTVIFDMGDGVSWSVNGADIPADTDLSNLDLGVSMNTDGIPVDVINAITGEAASVQITLAHDGDFGFALTLSAPLGEENAGYWANLYHYNETSETMDFETAALIDDDGTANLRMTHASQYAIVIDDHPHETVLPFTDVNANDWFHDPVVWAYNNGLMTGTSATTFEPNTATTRAMIVAILNRLEDGPTADGETFTDVADGDWYADAVNWAASVGIVAGFEDGTFRPNAPITREQMAAILYNYAQWKGIDVSNRVDLSRYNDQPSAWATDVMQWAVAEGLISGTSATILDPQGHATRAQVAAILERFLSE